MDKRQGDRRIWQTCCLRCKKAVAAARQFYFRCERAVRVGLRKALSWREKNPEEAVKAGRRFAARRLGEAEIGGRVATRGMIPRGAYRSSAGREVVCPTWARHESHSAATQTLLTASWAVRAMPVHARKPAFSVPSREGRRIEEGNAEHALPRSVPGA